MLRINLTVKLLVGNRGFRQVSRVHDTNQNRTLEKQFFLLSIKNPKSAIYLKLPTWEMILRLDIYSQKLSSLTADCGW